MGKFVIMALLGILCVNMSIYLVNEYDLISEYTYLNPVTPEEVKNKVDINGTITPDPNYVNQFYDIWGGMNKIWKLVGTLVLGLPMFMVELGAPTPIVVVVDAIYTFLVGIFLLELVTGRDFGE